MALRFLSGKSESTATSLVALPRSRGPAACPVRAAAYIAAALPRPCPVRATRARGGRNYRIAPIVLVIRWSGKTRQAGAPKHRQRFLSARPGGWCRTPVNSSGIYTRGGVTRRSPALCTTCRVERRRGPENAEAPRDLSARRQHSGPSSIRLFRASTRGTKLVQSRHLSEK